MCDADVAVQRVRLELAGKIVELPFGAPPRELSMVDRADAGRVITAIFEALEPVEQPLRDITRSDNSDNSAHAMTP
jgi:hypothetical protein